MTKLVGILNVTPDSFSDGGRYIDPKAAITQAQQLFDDGAALIDVGAESTRPNAIPLSHDEEWQRLANVLPELLRLYPGKISLDSYHPETIVRAASHGAVIVNDVTGLNNPAMIDVVLELQSMVIISHLPASNIAQAHQGVPIDSLQQVKDDLLAKAVVLESRGLSRRNIVLDPGIGFGKTTELNEKLLDFAAVVPDYPVMIGYSRKRFLGDDRMDIATNLAAGRRAIASGAAYLRVHDVASHHPLLLV